MKKPNNHLQAFAVFNDESRRCGIRVRRVSVIQIFTDLECASVEYVDGFFPVGRIVPFLRMSRRPKNLKAKIRGRFNLSRARQGSPAVTPAMAKPAGIHFSA
jgi:hypothetical protein